VALNHRDGGNGIGCIIQVTVRRARLHDGTHWPSFTQFKLRHVTTKVSNYEHLSRVARHPHH